MTGGPGDGLHRCRLPVPPDVGFAQGAPAERIFSKAPVLSPGGTMTDHPILELRQYTLHPGQRDALISLFEEHFLEGQRAVGIRVDGQFRREGLVS